MAAEILGAGDKVIKDTHDAFEPLDCGHLIELPRYGRMATDHLANIQRERVLHLGHVRRGAPRHIELRLAGQGRDGLEIGALQNLRELDLGDPAVKAKMRERYGKNVPLDERMISPAAMYESRLLVAVNQ